MSRSLKNSLEHPRLHSEEQLIGLEYMIHIMSSLFLDLLSLQGKPQCLEGGKGNKKILTRAESSFEICWSFLIQTVLSRTRPF